MPTAVSLSRGADRAGHAENRVYHADCEHEFEACPERPAGFFIRTMRLETVGGHPLSGYRGRAPIHFEDAAQEIEGLSITKFANDVLVPRDDAETATSRQVQKFQFLQRHTSLGTNKIRFSSPHQCEQSNLHAAIIPTDPIPDPRSSTVRAAGAQLVPYHAASTSLVEKRWPVRS